MTRGYFGNLSRPHHQCTRALPVSSICGPASNLAVTAAREDETADIARKTISQSQGSTIARKCHCHMLVRIHRARCLSQQPIILLQPRSALSRQFNSTLPKADEGIDDDQSRISWKARSQEEKVGEQVLKGAGTYDYIKRSTVGCKIPIQAGSRRPVRGANRHEGPLSSSTEAKPSPSPYKSTGQRKTVPRRLQIPATAQDDVAGRWAARGKNSNLKSASQPFGATKALSRWRNKLFSATQTRPQKGTEAEEQHKRVQAAFKVVRVACKTPHHAKKRLHLAEDIKKDLPELRKDFPWIFEWHTREINFTHEYLDAESIKENSSAKNQEGGRFDPFSQVLLIRHLPQQSRIVSSRKSRCRNQRKMRKRLPRGLQTPRI